MESIELHCQNVQIQWVSRYDGGIENELRSIEQTLEKMSEATVLSFKTTKTTNIGDSAVSGIVVDENR